MRNNWYHISPDLRAIKIMYNEPAAIAEKRSIKT
jgi:hypothetical protein